MNFKLGAADCSLFDQNALPRLYGLEFILQDKTFFGIPYKALT